jgi:ferredoxin
MCVGESPTLFTLDGDQARVLQGTFDAALLESARRAEEHCPNRAIRVERIVA